VKAGRVAFVVGLAMLFVESANATRFDLAPMNVTAASDAMIRVPGQVLPALVKATRIRSEPAAAAQPLTLTVTLNRDDQAGFESYLHNVYDPHSRVFHHFLAQREIADRFGPSQRAYDAVLGYLRHQGFKLVAGSKNRLTITFRGTRLDVQRAFALEVHRYRLGGRTFFANDRDPAFPAALAPRIESVAGLSNLALPARPESSSLALNGNPLGSAPNIANTVGICGLLTSFAGKFGVGPNLVVALIRAYLGTAVELFALKPIVTFVCGGMLVAVGASGITCEVMGMFDKSIWTRYPQCAEFASYGFGPSSDPNESLDQPSALAFADSPLANPSNGSLLSSSESKSQKIGLLEFDTFNSGDVENWLSAFGADAALSKLGSIPVNGGVAAPGSDQSEVLLDIDTVMLLASLPGIAYTVYDAPPDTSFETMFNAMINDGDTVISNSWSQCEDPTPSAEAQSIDSILQTAAASGISVLNGSGDTGSTCLDSSPNTIGVPADSPNATAVGGTTPTPGPGLTYGTEQWWNGTKDTPPTGQGGFGVSRFFPAPAYQKGLSVSGMRSVPDVVVDADPIQGMELCEADAGGCPTGQLYGGTSIATPEWAAFAADLNIMFGTDLGNLNRKLYALKGTKAFHGAASMGSDFAHVGLGSPDLLRLKLALGGGALGPVNVTQSIIGVATRNSDGTAAADGQDQATVQAILADARGFPVSGKTVSPPQLPAAPLSPRVA
jgi:subtilase family serine protease